MTSFHHSKFAILCYHRVGTEGVPYHSRLEPRIFEAQMRYLKRHYRLVSLSQLCLELQNRKSVPPTVAITFDDGYRDLHTYAFPVLRELQIPATIYLIGESMQSGAAPWYDRIFSAVHSAPGPRLETTLGGVRVFDIESPGKRSSAAWEIVCYLRSLPDQERREWCRNFEQEVPAREDELRCRMLQWQQVREMFRSGISFGAHTWTHPSVSRLSPDSFDRELRETKALIEAELRSEILDFAYPFGKPEDCSLLAERKLSQFGYRSAVTTSEGINCSQTSILRLRRMQIGEDPSIALFAFSVARMFLESAVEAAPLSGDELESRAGFTQTMKGLS